MEKNKNNLLSNIVLIRCFAIIIVVLGHSMIIYSTNWSIFEPKIQCNFFNVAKKYIDIFQMPLFIFVSGYVYHYVKVEKGKYTDFAPFLKNKFKRLIIPYLCVAVFYVLPIRFLICYEPYQGENLGSLLLYNVLLGKDIGHLWYLPTLFFVFIIFYFFEKLLKRIPWIINTVILAGLSSICGLFPNIFNISNVAQYLLFFYLGYIVRNFFNKKGQIAYTIPVLIFGILQFIGLFVNDLLPANSTAFLSLIKHGALRFGSVCSILFFYFLFTNTNKIFSRLSNNKYINFIDNESFSIYLFHSPLMYIILFFLSDTTINPVLLVSINLIVCLFGSLGISWLIQKTRVLNFTIGKITK